MKDRLRKINLFKELSNEELEVVTSLLQEEEYKKGSVIWEENTPEQGLHIIDKGKVLVCRKTREGRKQVLAILGENRFYGELSILDGREHSASVEALEDTKVFVLQKSSMDKLLQQNPQTAYNILRVMTICICELVRQMNSKFMDVINYVWD